MGKLANGLNGFDFAGGGHVIAAGDEFEGQHVAAGLFSFPDLGEAAFAQGLAQLATRVGFQTYL